MNTEQRETLKRLQDKLRTKNVRLREYVCWSENPELCEHKIECLLAKNRQLQQQIESNKQSINYWLDVRENASSIADQLRDEIEELEDRVALLLNQPKLSKVEKLRAEMATLIDSIKTGGRCDDIAALEKLLEKLS